MSAHAYTPRINTGGNFCGHDPLNACFKLAKPAKKGKGGLPRVLTLCMERFTDYFHRPSKVLPALNLANGSERQQRSERREACVILISALLKRTDLASLRVGIPTQDGFMNYTMDYIAKDTGMTLKRVERALSDLKAAGIVTVSQPRQLLPNGSWKGLAAVKAISKHLFGAFGLANMLKKERDKAIKRQNKKSNNKPLTPTEKARFNLLNKGILKRSLGASAPNKKFQPRIVDSSDDDFHYRKQVMLKAAEIKQANMSWNRDRCFEEAERQLLETRLART